MDTLQRAVERNLIAFDEEQKYITYLRQGKKRNFQNPEEKVQAETFCRLVLEYGYSADRIEMFSTVKMGVSIKEADIIVYADDEREKPYIVVECKSPEVSELEFKQAVEQAFSYAYAIAGTTKFIWVTKGNKQEFYRFDKEKNKRTSEADLPYFGQTDAKKYKYAKGGFYIDRIRGKEERIRTNDIEPVPESELTRIFKQAHDALWAGGELNPSQAFDELDKLIFCKVWDERNRKKGDPYQFQIFSEYEDDAKNLEALRKRVFELYDKGKDKDPEIFNKPIDLSVERIKTVVEYFQGISFSKTDLDSKGKAFETFLGTYFRGEFGQYFTPRNVVKFAVEALPITNEHRVLDTSCGSGGFLLYVLDKVRRQADKYFDLDNPDEKVEHYNYWHTFAEKNLFGIEINDQISRVAKMNMIIHDDGHTNVVTYDGLYQIDHIAEVKNNRGFKENSFDFIVTNPPFGSIVKQSEKAYMQVDKATAPYYNFALKETNWIDAKVKGKHTTTGRENQSTEVLFIEQGHKFLKEGGYLAVVVPDGILTNSSSQYVRDSIEEKFRIVGVVSLPQTTFTNTGAGVKSSILFLKKHAAETTRQIRDKKRGLQDRLADEANLIPTFEAWERERKEKLKPLLKVKTEENDAKKKEISEEYAEKFDEFREDLEERYEAEKRQLLDYPIFMAIADNIGYDAAGKNTYRILSREEYEDAGGAKFIKEIQQNDLFTTELVKRREFKDGKDTETTVSETVMPDAGIAGELRAFIELIETGQDHFFVSALS
ncbi:MAG TPA: N-6 DNA methylase [Pyrinomonadaceae bacterium]|jgi:type I restriction enzyme M protein|nr:N-6 DNA methylase [Pyrinomonadaceae bacterium]